MNREQIITITTQILEDSVCASHLDTLRDYVEDTSWDAYTDMMDIHRGRAVAKLEVLDVINPRIADLIRGEHNGLSTECYKQMYEHFLESSNRRARRDMLLNLADAGRLGEVVDFMIEFRDREIPKAAEHVADYYERNY